MRACKAAWLSLLLLAACGGQVGGQSGTETSHPDDTPPGVDCACHPEADGCESIRTSFVAPEVDDDAGLEDDGGGVESQDTGGGRMDLIDAAGNAAPAVACSSDAGSR